MNEKILENWAKLVLKKGVNLKEGENLLIKGEHIHIGAALALEKEGYKLGAKIVLTELDHPESLKNRVTYQKDEYLAEAPTYTKSKIDAYVNEKWSTVMIGGMEHPHIYEDMDQTKNATITKKYRELTKSFSDARMCGECAWTVTALPTPNWAAQIFEQEPSEELTKKLWEVMIPIYRLDHADPAKAWDEHSKNLHDRCKFLDDSNIDHVHFTGPGTDLKIYMSSLSRWTGGEWEMEGSKNFLPNIPTEEVFTTPDFRKTTGKVSVTRPVNVLGNQVYGAWFEFKDGEVVDYGAKERKDMLDQFFKIDPKAKRLGEVALVDVESPIYKADKTFYSILFDENAACHIALGKGITMGIRGGDKMSKEELEAIGYNDSLLHTDFMIGSPEVSVTAITKDKKEIKIIDSGTFVI
jgi:aminopeptidase